MFKNDLHVVKHVAGEKGGNKAKDLKSPGSQLGAILSQPLFPSRHWPMTGDISNCQNGASSEERPGLLLSSAHGSSTCQRIIQPKVSSVLRLRNPA